MFKNGTLLTSLGILCTALSIVRCIQLEMRLRNEKKEHERTERKRLSERNGRKKAEKSLKDASGMGQASSMRSIAVVESNFQQCHGVPRQASLAPGTRAAIRFEKRVCPTSFDELSSFSHIWILFLFHENTDFSKNAIVHKDGRKSFRAKVKPPRAGGKKVGVFATRTPHRPNPLGLTLGKIEHVDAKKRTVYVSGVDLVDGSPVLDIKPYLPMFDSIPQAKTASWAKFDTPRRDVTIRECAHFDTEECVKAFRKRGLFKNVAEVRDAVMQVLSVDVGRKPRESLPYTLQFENLSVCLMSHSSYICVSLLTTTNFFQVEYTVYNDMRVEILSVRPVRYLFSLLLCMHTQITTTLT